MLEQPTEEPGIECLGWGQVGSELFRYPHPPPLPISFGHEARSREPRDCHAEEAVRDGEIEKVVACRAGGLFALGPILAQPAVRPPIVEIAPHVAHSPSPPPPGLPINPGN